MRYFRVVNWARFDLKWRANARELFLSRMRKNTFVFFKKLVTFFLIRDNANSLECVSSARLSFDFYNYYFILCIKILAPDEKIRRLDIYTRDDTAIFTVAWEGEEALARSTGEQFFFLCPRAGHVMFFPPFWFTFYSPWKNISSSLFGTMCIEWASIID